MGEIGVTITCLSWLCRGGGLSVVYFVLLLWMLLLLLKQTMNYNDMICYVTPRRAIYLSLYLFVEDSPGGKAKFLYNLLLWITHFFAEETLHAERWFGRRRGRHHGTHST
jgi:hypothetical protein